MRVVILAAVLLATGCGGFEPTPAQREIAAECFAQAAYDAYRAETLASLESEVQPQKCCGQCGKNGLPPGKMLSGDKQKVVPCPCPDTCECKSKSCPNGKCLKP